MRLTEQQRENVLKEIVTALYCFDPANTGWPFDLAQARRIQEEAVYQYLHDAIFHAKAHTMLHGVELAITGTDSDDPYSRS